MYPLSISRSADRDPERHRVARYVLPLPVVGAGVSIYHMLIEYGAITKPSARASSPHPAAARFNWLARPARSATSRSRRSPSPRSFFSSDSWSLQATGDRRRRGYPSGRCLAVRERDSSGSRRGGGTTARALEGRRRSRAPGVAARARDRRRYRPRHRDRDRPRASSSAAAAVAAVGSIVPSRTWMASGDRKCRTRRTRSRAQPNANNLFKGIPQNGLVLGDPKAPVTMTSSSTSSAPSARTSRSTTCRGSSRSTSATGKLKLDLQPWAFLGRRQSFTRPGRHHRRRGPEQGASSSPRCCTTTRAPRTRGWLTDRRWRRSPRASTAST